MPFVRGVCAALALVVTAASAASADPPPLIPRDVLFGNPERLEPRLSPDARHLAYLAPDGKGVLQVWVRTLGEQDDAAVTAEPHRGIGRYLWAEDSATILYLQDLDGDENFHLHAVDVASRKERDLTPYPGVRATPLRVSPRHPTRILVEMNLRDRATLDVHRIELATGAIALDTRNPGGVTSWVANDDLVVRAAQLSTEDGGTEIRVRDGARAPWRSLLRAPPQDELTLVDLSADGNSVLLTTSLGTDTARVVLRNIRTGAEKVLAQDKAVDPGRLLVHPLRHVLQAVEFELDRPRWTLLDSTVKKDFDAFASLSAGQPEVVSRDRADRTWIVAFASDQGPTKWFRFNRTGLKGTFLFADRPRLEGAPLVPRQPVHFAARDGLDIHGYLTRPAGVSRLVPMVLLVHGGPWSRRHWGMDTEAQWLANRGYVVLQPNFRGSTGYGKAFLHAGDRQWGKAMQTDLVDAVGWAVKQGLADPARVAIAGSSYGGYATLAGLTSTPDLFRCGVDIVGPSNLFTLLASVPPYWKPLQATFRQRIGDIANPRDKELLTAASPLFSAERIKAPLLIAQGANDPRVKKAESEQIVAALEAKGLPVTYVLYPDEGHGFGRPENAMDFDARAEAFLSRYLGGRAEPLAGDRVPGSTGVVRAVAARAAGSAR